MERAVETAEALDRPFTTDAAWREMDVGGWDGLTNEEIGEQFAEELAALRDGRDVPLGGTGERYSELVDRVVAARDSILDRLEDGQSALVVCHGGVIEADAGSDAGDSRSSPARSPGDEHVADDRGDATMVWHQLVRFNDAAHLGAVTGWAGSRLRHGGLVVGLVRHGRTAANTSGHWQGQTDNGLNDQRRRQALDLAAWYGELGVVYTSPLGRAYQTAEALANGDRSRRRIQVWSNWVWAPGKVIPATRSWRAGRSCGIASTSGSEDLPRGDERRNVGGDARSDGEGQFRK